MYDDRPTAWEAWEVDAQATSYEVDDLTLVDARVGSNDQVWLVWETALGSRIEMNMGAGPTPDTLLFDLRVDWRERRRWLRLLVDLHLRAGFATAETQFGYLERPAHANTSWEQAKFEFAAHRWIDVSEANGGMSLVNDGMYGHSFEGSQVGLSLLRSPAHPHPRAPHPPYTFPGEEEHFTDQGRQHFQWMLVAHDGSWREGATLAMADALNGAPILVEGADDLIPDIRIPQGVGLEALKVAEDGDGYVLRLVDQIGARRTSQITLPARITSVEPVDLLEDPTDACSAWTFDAKAHTLRVTIGPFELVTFKLRVGGGDL
jgi:alpha-mannosidase